MSTESLRSILNKLHAMHAIRFITWDQVAKALKVHRQRVTEWVNQRDHEPGGVNAIKLLAFCADMTTKIAMMGGKQGRQIQASYRSAYLEAGRKFPGVGREK